MINSSGEQRGEDKLFLRLALGSTIVTFLLIVVGAITRVTQSGMGCGTDWPACNGAIIPDFTNTATVIEFGHRLGAPLVGLFGLALLIQAFRRHRAEPRLIGPAVLGFVLYLVQGGLGALTVKMSNEWVSVLLHLGNAMLLLAVYIVAYLNARHLSPNNQAISSTGAKMPFAEIILASLLAFTVAVIGAAVAGTRATKACVGWPLCAGELWPADQGSLQLLNMTHRLVPGGLGVFILVMLFRVRQGIHPVLRNALLVALAIYLLQAALGATVVLVNDPIWLVIAQSLHVTFATGTWSAMVIASSIVWLQQQSNRVGANPTQPFGAPSATTSS